MRCPGCKYITFDHLDVCPKCGADLSQVGSKLFQFRGEPRYSIWMWLQVPAGEAKRERDQGVELGVSIEDGSLPEAAESITDEDDLVLVVDDDLIEVAPVEEDTVKAEPEPVKAVDTVDIELSVFEREADASDRVEIDRGPEPKADDEDNLDEILAGLGEGEDEDIGEIIEDLEGEKNEADVTDKPVVEESIKITRPEIIAEETSEETDENLDIEITDVDDLEIDFEDLEVIEEEDGKDKH
ncbi:hypothetical protein [Thermodesulforhabdus norvegica]|uniref:Uncharacterized protein n=1 Tax=Thermodesulforhabdus norvegica TaxID=39841 RepID=A0A1I4S6P3_9BACT|nr:hypothetical protein [Thermodesulforhabdus norvegica]SFM59940.1 hypothetical protein SAMN05660836_00780 [Thermodesulforhabdus norvegica]